MVHNFESWYKSKRKVNEQMTIKVSGGGGGNKSSNKSSDSNRSSNSSNKTSSSRVDLAKVEAFFNTIPGVEKVETGTWGPESKSCFFPYAGKKYQIFVWPKGFAVRNTENWQFSDFGSDSKQLSLTVSDYNSWSGTFKNAANVSQQFSNWDDFVKKLMESKNAAASVQYGNDDATRADTLITEIVGMVDGLLKSDGFKGMFKSNTGDNEEGAVNYISNDWFKTGQPAQKMKELKSEIDKLPPQDKGGSGNRERIEKAYNLLNWEIGSAAGDGKGNRSWFGKCIIDNTNEFRFNWTGPNGPESRIWYTDF
jgi:hypothetical protein